MTSKFSIDNRELLQRISSCEAVVGIDFGNLIVRELAAFRLAAMDSEPVAVIDLANLDYLLSGADADVWPPEREEMGDVLLYRHPQPAPDLNSVSINDNHPLPNPPAENGIPKTAYCGEGLCLSEPITPDTIEGVLPPEMIARGNKIVNPRSAGLYLNDILHPALVVPDELKEAAADFLTVLDEYPEQLVPINKDSAVVRALRAAMLPENPVCTCPSGDGSLRWPCPVHPGNSPVVPDEIELVANTLEHIGNFADAAIIRQLAANQQQDAQQNIPEIIPDSCTWTFSNYDDHWSGTCGVEWIFPDGGPEENGVKFCPKCGKSVAISATE